MENNCLIKIEKGISKTGKEYYYLSITNVFGLEERIYIDKKTIPYYEQIIKGVY